MKFLKSYKQFEEYDETIGPDINLGLEISYDELINASNLVELDFESLFKTYNSKLEDLVASSDFLSELAERELVASEVFDTKEQANLLKENIKYVFLYSASDEEQNIDPVYVLIQSDIDKIKLYYTAEDLNRFHEKLSTRVIKIKDPSDPMSTYIYNTSNGGVNWKLQNNVESDKFKTELDGETLTQWLAAGEIELDVTN